MTTSRSTLGVLIAALLLLAACGSDKPVQPAREDAASSAVVDAPATQEPPAASAPAASVLAGNKLLDVRPLAGQSEAGLQAMLGAPTSCETVANGRQCNYARGAAEVVFIDGMADWITITDLGGAPFSAEALSRIGLGNEAPAVNDPDLIRWDNIGGMREISLFPGPDGRAGYILIKTMTI